MLTLRSSGFCNNIPITPYFIEIFNHETMLHILAEDARHRYIEIGDTVIINDSELITINDKLTLKKLYHNLNTLIALEHIE